MRWRRLLLLTVAVALLTPAAVALSSPGRHWRRPPSRPAQWFWEIAPPRPGLAGLPPTHGTFPAPGGARVWDTDLFADSNRPGRLPTGRSAVVSALHRAGTYSICYVEAGAFQSGFSDDGDFAPADDGARSRRYEMRGYPNEWWFDLRGFARYRSGRAGTLSGAAVNIAAGLRRRIDGCAREGQDAIEADDLDAYLNRGATGVPGGGWHDTRADALGFERWLVSTAHAAGLAAFQKNDPQDAPINATSWDGMVIEECNFYRDPCAGPGGDGTAYLRRNKPVLDAEYTSDGESTARFCRADARAAVTGALFDVGLDGRFYRPCPRPDPLR